MFYIIDYGRGPRISWLPHFPTMKRVIGPYFTRIEAIRVFDLWTKES